MFEFSTKSIKNMQGIDPRLKQIAERALIISPIDFGIPNDGGVRMAQRQHELFVMGRSKCDGYEKKSKHQIAVGDVFGKAVDYFVYKDGQASWDKLLMTTVACCFLQAACELGYNIQWGGLWKSFQDMPHIQINDEFI